MSYDRTIGRLRLRSDGDPANLAAVTISVPDGWNDSCKILTLRLSVEELRDLKHLIERALYHAKRK